MSGAGNALSEVLYGTGELKGVKDAFLRGVKTGAVMSGIDNIARAAGIRGMEPGINPDGGGHSRGAAETAVPGYTGRDPKSMCGAADPFDLSSGLGTEEDTGTEEPTAEQDTAGREKADSASAVS